MICQDCADGADIASSAIALMPPDLAAIVEANHHMCRIRNRDREPGQSPDCTCQHQPRTELGDADTEDRHG